MGIISFIDFQWEKNLKNLKGYSRDFFEIMIVEDF
jgi:hypothetical protein